MQLLHPPGSLALDTRTFGDVDQTFIRLREDDTGVSGDRLVEGDVVAAFRGRRSEATLAVVETSTADLAVTRWEAALVVRDDGALDLVVDDLVLPECVEMANPGLDTVIDVEACGVRLRPVEQADAASVVEASTDPDINRFTMLVSELSIERAQRRATFAERSRRQGTAIRFAVVDRSSGDFLGEIGASLDSWRRAVEIYYWLLPACRGRGIGTAALREICRWSIDTFDPIRLELKTAVDNVASQRIATKVGFRHEGTAVADLWVDDEANDLEHYAMTPAQFELTAET